MTGRVDLDPIRTVVACRPTIDDRNPDHKCALGGQPFPKCGQHGSWLRQVLQDVIEHCDIKLSSQLIDALPSECDRANTSFLCEKGVYTQQSGEAVPCHMEQSLAVATANVDHR